MGVIAAIVIAFVVIRSVTAPPAPTAGGQASTQRVVATITSIPAQHLDQVGQGTATNSIKAAPGPLLTGPTGKPEVLYVGGEYCPYCAAERWALIVALSRFGTFSGLKETTSSGSDVFPNTPTFTFRGSTYTSQYIDFVPVEEFGAQSNQEVQRPTPEQQALIAKYDAAPYTDSPGAIPFVDFGNRYVFSGSTYQPDVLQGMSWEQIAASLQQPSSGQAKAILGSANLITASVCQISGQQPAQVCASPTIKSIGATLRKSQG
jgi:hypothetical protein